MDVGTLKSNEQAKPKSLGNVIVQVTGQQIVQGAVRLEVRQVVGQEVAANKMLLKLADANEAEALARRKFSYLKDEALERSVARTVQYASSVKRPTLDGFLSAEAKHFVGLDGIIQLYDAELHNVDGSYQLLATGASKMLTSQDIHQGNKKVLTGQVSIEGSDGENGAWRKVRLAMTDKSQVVNNAADLKSALAHQLRLGNEPFIRLIEENGRQGILISAHMRDENGRMVVDGDGKARLYDPETAVEKGLQNNRALMDRALQRESVIVEVIPTRSFPVTKKTVEYAAKFNKMPLDRYQTDGTNRTEGSLVGLFNKVGYRQSFVTTITLNRDNEPVQLALDAAPIGKGRRANSILDLPTKTFNPYEPTQRPKPSSEQRQTVRQDKKPEPAARPTTDKGRPLPVNQAAQQEAGFSINDDPDHVPGETMTQGLKRIENELTRGNNPGMGM